jgi:hypothetical protein
MGNRMGSERSIPQPKSKMSFKTDEWQQPSDDVFWSCGDREPKIDFSRQDSRFGTRPTPANEKPYKQPSCRFNRPVSFRGSKRVGRREGFFVAMKNKISHQRLIELLEYEPETGHFRWRITFGRLVKGKIAGKTIKTGYRTISIDGTDYRAHRLAWFYVNQEWPGLLDHRNEVKTDNRIDNLREATKSQNAMNCGNRSDNKTGAKGVSWYAKANRWIGQIQIGRKSVFNRRFENFDDAVNAVKEARIKFNGEFTNHGNVI